MFGSEVDVGGDEIEGGEGIGGIGNGRREVKVGVKRKRVRCELQMSRQEV